MLHSGRYLLVWNNDVCPVRDTVWGWSGHSGQYFLIWNNYVFPVRGSVWGWSGHGDWTAGVTQLPRGLPGITCIHWYTMQWYTLAYTGIHWCLKGALANFQFLWRALAFRYICFLFFSYISGVTTEDRIVQQQKKSWKNMQNKGNSKGLGQRPNVVSDNSPHHGNMSLYDHCLPIENIPNTSSMNS